MKPTSIWMALRAPTLALLASLLVGAALVAIVGENPLVLFQAFRHTLFTGFGLGYTLFYATPLVFTGLSVAICFHCGLFNIGAEGQLYLGTLCLVAAALHFPHLPAPLAIPLAAAAAVAGGAIWGGIAGFLKAKRGSHEVIVTILLNFIGYAIVDYGILYVLKDPNTQNPQTLPVASSYRIPSLDRCFHWMLGPFFQSTPANATLFLAIATAIACYYFLFHTTHGYELRAVGKSPRASLFAGISVPRSTMAAFALSGGLAGLVGLNEVLGYQHVQIQGFSPGYGFTGIAVALLARNHPIGILLSAFLFGALQNSARELEFLSDKVTKELALVLQGTLIALIACDYLIERFLRRRREAAINPTRETATRTDAARATPPERADFQSARAGEELSRA